MTASRERAEAARQADRRPVLVRALQQRTQVEERHGAAVAERARQARDVVSFVTALGATPATVAEAAADLRQWLDAQEQARLADNQRDQLEARLDQALGGHGLAQLQAELGDLLVRAGPDPGDVPGDMRPRRCVAPPRAQAMA